MASGACLTFWLGVCAQSGGDCACLLLHDLRFGAEPVVQLVAVLPASFLIEFLCAEADLVFELLWVACHGRWRFLGGICIHGGDSFEATVRANTSSVNSLRLVQ